MGFAGGKLFSSIIFGLMTIALVLQVLGLSLHYWWKTGVFDGDDLGQVQASGGIWGACLHVLRSGITTCFEYGYIYNLQGWFNAVRALSIVGSVLILLALSCVLVTFIRTGLSIAKLVGSILCFIAFVCITVEWALFVGHVNKFGYEILSQWEDPDINVPIEYAFQMSPASYSGSMAITVVAALLSLVSGILELVHWHERGKEDF